MAGMRLITSVHGQAKYKQAKESIWLHIRRSGARPGDKVCTEAVLMKTLGISVTTVRRALDELVREGILVRRVGKGTFLKNLPDESGSVVSSTVLLIGQNSWPFLREDVYFGRIIGALGDGLREAGLRQVVLLNQWGKNLEAELDDIRRHNPAAIICPYVSQGDREFLMSLSGQGIPLMIYGHPLEGLEAAQVYTDDYNGGTLVAEHLIKKGHRTFGVVGSPPESPAGVARFRGFVEAVSQRDDLQLVSQVHAVGFGEIDGYRAVEEMMRRGPLPEAIFCAGDLLAYGAIKRLEEARIAVPDRVAVAGYSDFEVSTFYHPQLTTVRVDLEGMGRAIAQWAVTVTKAPPADRFKPYIRKMPVSLVVRETA